MSSREEPSSRQKPLRASTADRLEAIVEAAERAAEAVIDDAEAQARSYLGEARERADREVEERLAPLAGVVDELLTHAAALGAQAGRLQAALEEVKERVERAPGADSGPGERPRHLAAVVALDGGGEAEADPGPAADAERGGAPSGARLLATQMAVSGSSREEIDQRLRNGFGIEDTTAILDAIMGPEES